MKNTRKKIGNKIFVPLCPLDTFNFYVTDSLLKGNFSADLDLRDFYVQCWQYCQQLVVDFCIRNSPRKQRVLFIKQPT
jgi:hypothetical protein